MEKVSEHGECCMWEQSKGYGFLRSDAGGPDIFCHISQLADHSLQALCCGERVTFTRRPGQKGPMATHVELEE